MSQEALLRKVQALLALAQSPNENEALAAAAKAQELIALYNLDLTRSGATEADRKGQKIKGGLYKWQRSLWESIAATNFCLYWCDRGTAKGSKFEHNLLGREVNVASARVLAEYLEGAINRLVRERFGNDPRAYFCSAANSYREGIADTLRYRLWEKREAQKVEEARRNAATPTGNALVTIGDAEDEERWANLDAQHGYKPGTTKARALEWKANHRARRRAEEEADAMLKASDPEGWQRKEDEAKAERERASAEWEKRWKKRRKPAKDKPAEYYIGRQVGETVSLNEQIDEVKVKGRLGIG